MMDKENASSAECLEFGCIHELRREEVTEIKDKMTESGLLKVMQLDAQALTFCKVTRMSPF